MEEEERGDLHVTVHVSYEELAYADTVYTVGWTSVVVCCVELAIYLFQHHHSRTRVHRLEGPTLPDKPTRHVGLRGLSDLELFYSFINNN